MRNLTNEILELIRRTSSSLPEDVGDRSEDFPVVVTMDAHGQSKHSLLEESSQKVLDDLLARPY